MQYSELAPKPIQFLDTGAHCSRLAKKKPMIQLLVTATIVHMKPLKITPERSLAQCQERQYFESRIYGRCCIPSVKEKDAQLRESERQRLSQLRRENALLSYRQQNLMINAGGCGPATRPLYDA